jgi:hypothetical protein
VEETGMARCPECGKWIWGRTEYFEERVCPECGAILKRESSPGGFFLGNVKVVGHAGDRSPIGTGRPEAEADSHGHGWSLRELEQLNKGVSDEDRGLSKEPKAVKKEPSLRGDEVKWANCSHCGGVIMLSNAKFCSNCGARLSHGPEAAGLPTTEGEAKPDNQSGTVPEHGEECMVCNLELNENDDVVWCPHCGDPAHKTHLLEWIRMRNTCPICGKHLSEQFFEESTQRQS